MKRILTLAVVVLLVLVSPAAAQDSVISIPIGTVVRTAPGVITELGTADVPLELQGRNCTGRVQAENQESVHPGNDILIDSGGVTTVIPDVEGQAGDVLLLSDPLTLGPTVTVSVRMGPDGTYSGGVLGFFVDCPPPPTTTTTTTTSTTTTTTSTTTTVPTTTSPTTVPPTVAQTSSAPTTVPPTTLPSTGADTSEPALFGGLALLTAGVFLVVSVELRRRTKTSDPRG